MVDLLAGITAVPQDVIDAATVDGAGFWRRNYQIIVRKLRYRHRRADLRSGIHVQDLSVVYLLTNGGPVNATQVLGNLGFLVGITDGDVAHGAAISLFMFPVLLVMVILMLRFIRRQEI